MMMRRTLQGLLFGLVLAVAAPAPTAHATSLAELTTAQMTDASTYILEGQVTDVWSEVDDNGYVWSRTRVAVTETHKGPDSPTSVVVDVMGGQLGQLHTVVPGRARFSDGEDVLLFLAEVDFGRRLTPVGAFTGKFTIRRAPGESRKHLIRWHGSDEEVFDHRFVPHPAPAARVYLDEMLDTVETRLDVGWDGQPVPGISLHKLETINTPARRMR